MTRFWGDWNYGPLRSISYSMPIYYNLTRFWGDWNFWILSIQVVKSIILQFDPILRGLKRQRFSLCHYEPLITIWPDFEGIETSLNWDIIKLKIITIWPDFEGIETFAILINWPCVFPITIWPDFEGIETQGSFPQECSIVYYNLTRFWGDWNFLLLRLFPGLLPITIWPDFEGIETLSSLKPFWYPAIITIWPDFEGIETPIAWIMRDNYPRLQFDPILRGFYTS